MREPCLATVCTAHHHLVSRTIRDVEEVNGHVPGTTMRFSTRVPAELRVRERVGALVREVCRHVESVHACAGLEWRMLSAFNEAFNNLAEHGFDAGEHGHLRIVVTVDPARLVLELEDDGRGFDFEARSKEPLAPVEDLDAGGMGLIIIRRAVSSVTYTRGRPNRLTLVQRYADCTNRDATDDHCNDEERRC